MHTDEWLRWLEMETARRVGAFGLAGAVVRIAPFLVADSPLARVLQLPDSVEGREADFLKAHSRPLQVTYGYLSAAPAKPDACAETVLANALTRAGLSVLLLESGGERQMEEVHPLNAVELTAQNYRGATEGRFRGLGGTSTR